MDTDLEPVDPGDAEPGAPATDAYALRLAARTTARYLRGELSEPEAAATLGISPEELRALVGQEGGSEERALEERAAEPADARTPLPLDFKLSVLMPVYNERETIREIIRRVRAVDVPKEIVIVDDGSQDGTQDVLKREVEGQFPDVKVVYHGNNRGKGAAIRTAIPF